MREGWEYSEGVTSIFLLQCKPSIGQSVFLPKGRSGHHHVYFTLISWKSCPPPPFFHDLGETLSVESR